MKLESQPLESRLNSIVVKEFLDMSILLPTQMLNRYIDITKVRIISILWILTNTAKSVERSMKG